MTSADLASKAPDSQRRRLQADVEVLRRDAAEASARLDSILADG
jgi:hypothetical protein